MPCPAERLNATGDAPKPLRDVLTRARGAWLRNEHVVDLLRNHRAYNFPVSRASPAAPPSGCLFLFNRRATRYFRRDGHCWRTKSDGKTVRETHEKLKVAGKDALNCYYAHTMPGGGGGNGGGNGNGNGSDSDAGAPTTTATTNTTNNTSSAVEGLQRRCYWLLQGDEGLVLVHYLAVAPPPSALRASQALLSSAAAAVAAAAAAAGLGLGLRPPSPLYASAASALCRAASAPVSTGRGGGSVGGGGGSNTGNGNGGNQGDPSSTPATAATTTTNGNGNNNSSDASNSSSLLQLRMLLPEGVSHEAGPRGVTVTTGAALAGTLGRSASGGGGGGGGVSPEAAAAIEATVAAAAAGKAAPSPSPFAAAPSSAANNKDDNLPSNLFPSASSLERAATAPAAGLAWQRCKGALLLSPSPSGFFSQLNELSIGPLHRAPSRSGSTVQTGETLDGAAAAAVAAIAAEAEERSKKAAGVDEEVAAVAAAVAAEFGEGRREEGAKAAAATRETPIRRQQSNNASYSPAEVTLTLSESSRLAAAARTAALSS